MTELRLTHTDRLELRAVDPGSDLEALFAIWSDPASWRHAPEYRHPEPRTTREWLELEATHWDEEGLGYWTARLRESGEVVGAGGARRHRAGFWNLLWRIDGARQGHGYATELGRAAVKAARTVDDSLAAIAWIVPVNVASRRVADRLGLIEHEQRLNVDGRHRIPYADRPLRASELARWSQSPAATRQKTERGGFEPPMD
ncbi:MAG TPA: GNAT family N-acetyltransferase [Solirubrobacteraceae bacterium]|nr:GNAT family N-acetyltransferase [Solirubrobacteraceae bacterium]